MGNLAYHTILAEPYDSNITSLPPVQTRQACPRRKPVPTYCRNDESILDGGNGTETEPDRLLNELAKPEDTRTLQNGTYRSLLRILIDVILIVLPCFFIALAIIAAYLNGHPFSSYGQKVEQASRLGPTIFPIAFAAIVARFNRHLATWQAERGQRLGVCYPMGPKMLALCC